MSSFFQFTKKWAAYQDGDYTFLQNNNYHQKLFKIDLRYQNQRSKIQIQQSIHQNNESRVSSTGEVKFQFPLGLTDRSIYSRITSQSKFGLFYDNGNLQLKNGQKINFYSGFQTNKNFTNNIYKLGASIFTNNYLYALRIRYGVQHNSLFFYLKGNNQGLWNNNKWKINFYTIFDPKINKLVKNGILLALLRNNQYKDKFYLRFQNGKKNYKGIHWCEIFKIIKINITRQISQNSKIGLETKFDLGNWQNICSNITFGGQWKLAQKAKIRAKIDNNLTNTFSVTYNIPEYGNYSFGVQWSGVGRQNIFKFGTGISLNL